ncbi:hypothetical protein [Streptomyces sp. NPDC060194]|uniref:hypothetical protein n=1 Tax=Streptomyces sp. NPDC060194 TaxID=3347069 RepID=UPI003662A372
MKTYALGPTKLLTAAERLLVGKGVDSAVGAGRAEDWGGLDGGVHLYTALRGRGSCRILVGFRWVDQREIVDWERAPRWRESASGGAPSWSATPTESERVLGLAHADPRVRAAALARPLPSSVLPLVLIRCSDSDERVHDLARTVLTRALAAADEALLRDSRPWPRW